MEAPAGIRRHRARRRGATLNQNSSQSLARALGWFSIGLGAAEILFPRQLSRMLGVREHPGLFRLLGVREITSGIGILSTSQPAGWVWSRVAGDAMDLALLGGAMRNNRSGRNALAAATAAVAGVAALDFLCGNQLTQHGQNGARHLLRDRNEPRTVGKSITINRPAGELYNFWRNFENLPRIMQQLEWVEVLDNNRSRWRAKGPMGVDAEWEAEMVQDIPNQLISWRSLPDSTVQHSGSVRFEPATGGRGTIVRVEMDYAPPGGAIGVAMAKLHRREPGQEVHDSLRHFRQLMETGVIPTIKGQSSGRKEGTSKKFDYPMPKGEPRTEPRAEGVLS